MICHIIYTYIFKNISNLQEKIYYYMQCIIEL
jgi:hypothetical protein